MQADDLDPEGPGVGRYRRAAQAGEEEEPPLRQAEPPLRVQVVLEMTGLAEPVNGLPERQRPIRFERDPARPDFGLLGLLAGRGEAHHPSGRQRAELEGQAEVVAGVERVDDLGQGTIAEVELDEGGTGEPVDVGPAIERLQQGRDPGADLRILRESFAARRAGSAALPSRSRALVASTRSAKRSEPSRRTIRPDRARRPRRAGRRSSTSTPPSWSRFLHVGRSGHRDVGE